MSSLPHDGDERVATLEARVDVLTATLHILLSDVATALMRAGVSLPGGAS